MDDAGWIFLIPIAAILGGVTITIVATVMKSRVRELEIKERIALIERGLVPPPEKDPHAFERAMNRYDQARDRDDDWDWQGRGRSPRRYRSVGITLIGVGFGLMMMIGIAGGNPQAGVGVGGFLVILGAAFFVNSLFDARQEPAAPGRRTGAPAAVSAPPRDSQPPA